MPYLPFSRRPIRSSLARAALGLALSCALQPGFAAGPDIVGRYVAKDAEFVIEKGAGNEYKMQYFGRCLREGQPFEFFTNGKAKKLSDRSFVISVTASRVPSCARFAPLDGQDHNLEISPDNPEVWYFRKSEPNWLTKQAFVRQK